MHLLETIQRTLSYEKSVTPHFIVPNGIGRHGLSGIFVGTIFGSSSTLVLLSFFFPISAGIVRFATYSSLLAAFHFLEWYITAVYRPKELCYESWIINHSKPYTIAQVAAVAEYVVEAAIFGEKLDYTANFIWTAATLGLCVFALGIRAAAMITAGNNFNHRVMYLKIDGHEIVKHGIYHYLRHPSYFGWFCWAVASQLLLQNPLCTLAYFIATTQFFKSRVVSEESALVEIYGDEYKSYAMTTPILIPFVSGEVPFSLAAFRSKGAPKAN